MTCLGCNGCVVVDRSCVVGPSRGETRGEKRGETHGDKRGEKRRRNTRRKTAKHAATNAAKNGEQRRIPDTCLISGRRKTRRKTATHAAKNAAKNGLPRTSTSHLTRRRNTPTNVHASHRVFRVESPSVPVAWPARAPFSIIDVAIGGIVSVRRLRLSFGRLELLGE